MGCRLRIFLTQEEKATLDELRKATLVPQRTKDRAFVLLLNARGWKNAQIAEILNWAEKTVRQTIHRFSSLLVKVLSSSLPNIQDCALSTFK